MNAVLYARVSTEKQADKELSIPAQLQAMRSYAKQHGFFIVREFIEPGASAKTSARPQLQALLTFVRASDHRVQVLLVHKIDRLARNVYDHATIRAFLNQHGIRLASVVENVDDSIPGQLVENIMASIAQFYAANLGEEVKKGLNQKIMRGEWPHLPPFGYVQVRNEHGTGSHVEVQPNIGPMITRAFELYGTGNYSLHALAERLALEGLFSKHGTRLSQAQVLRMLTNPFYAGRLRWKGQNLPGTHAPLVGMDTFNRVQDVVRKRHRHVGTKNSVPGFPLRGWALCSSCRGRMTGERHDRWLYYRCSRQSYKRERCNAKFCNAATAHQDLARICRSVQITRALVKQIRHAARKQLASKTTNRRKLIAVARKKRMEASGSEAQLTNAFARGDLTPLAFNARMVELVGSSGRN